MNIIKKILLIATGLILLSTIWICNLFWSITNYANSSEPQKADVIIVLGAAVWEYGPSPAMQARVDLAYRLFQMGYATNLLLSGGQGRFGPTEADAMANLLIEKGVDARYLILEIQSTNTFENLLYSKKLMDEHGFKTALIVTDTFHLKRAIRMAQDLGITAFGAPATESILNKNKSLKYWYTLREVLALTKYYFVGS